MVDMTNCTGGRKLTTAHIQLIHSTFPPLLCFFGLNMPQISMADGRRRPRNDVLRADSRGW